MNEEDPEVPATGCSSRGAGAILSPPSGPHQGRYDIPLGFLDPLPTATTVAALLGGSSSGSPELFSDAVPPRSDSPTIPPPSAETRPSAQGGRLDGAIMDDGKTATTPHPMVRSSESTLTTNGACWSSGEHNGMPLSSMTERGAVLVSISIPNAPDGASLNASVDPGTNAGCTGGTATGSSTDAVELTSISAVALGAEKGSHERLRLLLLDHADREAAFYPNDHAARRRVAVLHASVMSHNDRVQANLRRFFQYSAETGAAATPPQTDKFVPIGVPPHFIDPVTHRMMGDPVVFLDKRIVDRSVAEALVFRLFSTMIRCNAVGTTKRREFFTYCLERVLISTVAKQWSREVFGFHGLQMTPRRDIALATEQWLLGVLALHKDVRDTVENTIRDELGMPPCDDTGISRVDPPGTVIVLGTATIAIGEFASTPLSSLERAVGDKHPRAWDTLEHMWRDACKLAVRGRKKQSSTTGMKKPRPSNLEALAATAAAARRRCSTSREQSNDRGPSTPVKRTPSAGGDDNNAATPSGWQCMPSIDIGIGIADSASTDVVQAIVKALVAEESAVRVGLEATILTESAALETHVAAQMEDAVRAMRPQRRRVSTTSSSNVRPSTTGGKPSSTPRPASPPLAGGLAPDPRRMPEKKLHHAVRHRVLSEAGSNHRAPHRPGQLSGVFSCASMHPPPTTSGGGIDPLTALMPPHQGIEGIDSALAIQPPLCNTIAPNDVAGAETKDSPLAAATVDQPNLLQALDSLTGIAECVRVPRKMEEIHVPRESGHPVVSLEEVSLVSAAMRFHQDHELFDLVFDFNEKWFLDLEHRSMKWAEAQFNHMAEQEALQRTLGTRKLQHQRAVLRPHTCVVARQPRQPPPSTAAIAPPRSKRRSERRLTHGGSQDCAQLQSTAVPPCATAVDMQDNDIVDRLEGNCEPVDGENAVGEHEAVGTTELPEADAMQATDAPQAPSLQSTPRVTPAPCTSASGIQPSSGWRQRIPYAGVGTCHEQLARAATKPPPPPRPTLHPDVAVAMAMKAVDGPLSYMIPDLATNYVPLKPAWVGNPRHASCRPKPSPSSRFVDDDYIAPPDNEEFPTDHLLRELEAMYVSYDEGNVRKDVLRKRELGPYFFEPIVYAEEVARKAKEREDCVTQQIAKVTNKQLKAHWDAPTAVDQTSSIDGGVGRDHGAPLNLSPRTTHYPKVPLRPLSSTVSARHWLAAVQQPTGGKASPIARRTSTASAASARRAVDAPSGVVEGIAKTYAARFDSCAPFLPKVAGREK